MRMFPLCVSGRPTAKSFGVQLCVGGHDHAVHVAPHGHRSSRGVFPSGRRQGALTAGTTHQRFERLCVQVLSQILLLDSVSLVE